MRVLFDLGHPAHVHLFRNAIVSLKTSGHMVLVTASEREVAVDLLQQYRIPFVSLGRSGCTLGAKGVRLAISAMRLSIVALRFSPDVIVAVSPVRAAPVAWVLRRACVGMDDTEHATLARHLYMPFVKAVLTPAWYGIELGPAQVRYHGFHELAYLHPNRFEPDAAMLREAGIAPGEIFSVVRFVSASASHDCGHTGFDLSARSRLVKALAEHGRVVVSSEMQLPAEVERHRMRCRASALHHLLAFASVYVGDAGTTTTEAALLGTPSVFCGTVGPLVGNFRYLEGQYGLVRCFVDSEQAINCAVGLVSNPTAKGEWSGKRETLLRDCVDVTDALLRFLETFCDVCS